MRLFAAQAQARARALEPYNPGMGGLFQPSNHHSLGGERAGPIGGYVGQFGGGYPLDGRMMLGSEYGNGTAGFMSYSGQKSMHRRGLSVGRSAVGYAEAMPQMRVHDACVRRPLATRMDVPTMGSVNGYLDPLEGLAGLGTF